MFCWFNRITYNLSFEDQSGTGLSYPHGFYHEAHEENEGKQADVKLFVFFMRFVVNI
jgi:hypothetical protein